MAEGRDETELAARDWVEEMRQIQQGSALMAPEQVATVYYESLLEASWHTLNCVLASSRVDAVGDPGYGAAVARLDVKPAATCWDRGLTSVACKTILSVRGPELQRWDYDVAHLTAAP